MTLRRHPDADGSAVERGAAAVGLRDRAHDREPKSGTAARARVVTAGEALERAVLDVGGEAGAVVGDLERNAPVVGVRAQRDVAAAVAERVVDEVAERLA